MVTEGRKRWPKLQTLLKEGENEGAKAQPVLQVSDERREAIESIGGVLRRTLDESFIVTLTHYFAPFVKV